VVDLEGGGGESGDGVARLVQEAVERYVDRRAIPVYNLRAYVCMCMCMYVCVCRSMRHCGL
jgi:hypothetical protein